MQAVDLRTVEEVYKILGEELFDQGKLDYSENYALQCVSVFDHLLTNEEAEKKILFYQNAVDSSDADKALEYHKHHDRMIKFYLDLYDMAPVYRIFDNRIVSFDNQQEYKSHVILNVREQLLFRLVIPKLSTIAAGGYDLTQLFYTLKCDLKKTNILKKIIESNELFFFDVST